MTRCTLSPARLRLFAALALLAALVLAAPAWAITSYGPIAPGPWTVLPDYVGSPATAQPLPSAGVPQNPYLAPIPYSYLHDDSWNSDTTSARGPLGHHMRIVSSTLGMPAVLHQVASSSCMAFDRHGRLITAFVGAGGMSIFLQDPVSLDILAGYKLVGMGTSSLGNAYFFVDQYDRIVIGYGTDKIITLRQAGTLASPRLVLVQKRQWDLSAVVPADDHVAGLMSDWRGRIWFQTAGVGGEHGPRVGVIDPATSRIKWAQLPAGEQISNGLAVTSAGTFVLTSSALYKFAAASDGQPRQVWSATYDHSVDKTQLGQLSLGSGTSPTVLGGGKYVAINDSGEQMNVVVFRTADTLKPGQDRLVGALPVFTGQPGQAAANSLLGYRRSIIVENNYGYMWGWDADGTLTSSSFLPGIERLRITSDEKLVKLWENVDVAANSVPKLSTRTGLLYVVARKTDPVNGAMVFYLTALDFRTGTVKWEKLMGTGIAWDNYWSAPAIGRDGTYYIGNYGGLVAMRDGR